MRLRRMLAVSAMTGALALTGAVPTASAAPVNGGSGVAQSRGDVSTPRGGVSTQDSAPDCVTFKVHTFPGYVRVFNGCATNLRLRPIISFGPDGTCEQVPAGTHHDWWLPVLRIDHIESC